MAATGRPFGCHARPRLRRPQGDHGCPAPHRRGPRRRRGYKIQAANVNARAVAGTNPTMKVLVKSGAYTNYSGTLTAAGTPKDLTAGTTTLIADESTVAVDLVMGGTSPQFRDLTLFILLKRR